MKSSELRIAFVAILALACCRFSGIATAADISWTGNANSLWSDAGNWNPGLPGTADRAVFNSAGNGNTTVTVGAHSIDQLLFDTASAASYTLGTAPGTGTINFVRNTASTFDAISLTAANANPQTINSNMTIGLGSNNTSITYNIANNSAAALTIAGNITANGTSKSLGFTGTGTIKLGANVTFSPSNTGVTAALFDLNGFNLIATNLTGSGGTIDNTSSANSVLTIVGSSSSGTISSVIQDSGSGSLQLVVNKSANSVSLTSATGNTYTGGTIVQSGTLSISGSNKIGSGTLTLAGGTVGTSSSTTVNNAVVIQSSTTSTINNTQGITFTNNITGSGTLQVTTNNPKDLIFSGNNSGFTGSYIDNTDSLSNKNTTRFSSADSGSAAARWTFSGNVGQVNFAGGTIHFGKFSGIKQFNKSGGGGTTTLQIGALGEDAAFSGAITNSNGTLAITKVGSGVQEFSGVNTYTGGTTISNGTLLVNNTTGSGTGTAAVNVNVGKLGGTGAISGLVTVAGSATLAPGASAGSLVLGSLNLQSNSTLAIELGGTNFTFDATEDYDRLKVTGAVTLAGNLSVSLINGHTLTGGELYGIVDAESGLGTAFGNFAEGDTVLTQGAFGLKITYQGIVTDGSVSQFGGNDVVLYAVSVPEPSTWAMLLISACILAGWVARKKRNGIAC